MNNMLANIWKVTSKKATHPYISFSLFIKYNDLFVYTVYTSGKPFFFLIRKVNILYDMQ